mmetsp:Transcript_60957/g.142610  ORF Transcript_60957/g.142610 Transcript_60957/m.142610 type:complete len:256 (-) Transcript_60957:206-973(-)
MSSVVSSTQTSSWLTAGREGTFPDETEPMAIPPAPEPDGRHGSNSPSINPPGVMLAASTLPSGWRWTCVSPAREADVWGVVTSLGTAPCGETTSEAAGPGGPGLPGDLLYRPGEELSLLKHGGTTASTFASVPPEGRLSSRCNGEGPSPSCLPATLTPVVALPTVDTRSSSSAYGAGIKMSSNTSASSQTSVCVRVYGDAYEDDWESTGATGAGSNTGLCPVPESDRLPGETGLHDVAEDGGALPLLPLMGVRGL